MESRNEKKNASTHNELLAQMLSERKQITELRTGERNASAEIELLRQRQSEKSDLKNLKSKRKMIVQKLNC